MSTSDIIGLLGLIGLIGVIPVVAGLLRGQVKKSHERFAKMPEGILEHRVAMTIYALKAAGKTSAKYKLPRKDFLNHLLMLSNPSPLFPLKDVNIRQITVPDGVKQHYYNNDFFKGMAANVLPSRSYFVKFDRMSEAVQTIRKPEVFDDRCDYRLLAIQEQNGQLQLTFDKSPQFSYFDQINFHSLLEYELADAFSRRKWKITDNDIVDLKLRDWVTVRLTESNFTQFDKGMFFLGISTAVLVIKNGKFRLLLHERKNVATVPGTIHVVPAGEFQPVNSNATFEKDFNLWHSILREYCEELRGDEEVAGSNARGINYETGVYQLISQMIPEENRYCLGLGLDPVTLKAELLACLVIPFDQFKQTMKGHSAEDRDRYVRNLVSNSEGLIIGDGDDDLGIAIDPSNGFAELDHYLKREPRTLNATRMILSILKQHYPYFAQKYLGNKTS